MLDLQHNIVSILYSVKSMIESHLERVDEKSLEDPAKRLWYAEEILKRSHRQTQRAIEISKRLGRVLSVSAEHPAEYFRKASVQFAWKQVLAHLKKNHHSHAVQIIDRIPADFPPVFCDRTEIREILFLLAHNALQAMAAGKNVQKKLIIPRAAWLEPAGKAVCGDYGGRYRSRNSGGLARPCVRTLLHHQDRRRGQRFWLVSCQRTGPQKQRPHRGVKRHRSGRFVFSGASHPQPYQIFTFFSRCGVGAGFCKHQSQFQDSRYMRYGSFRVEWVIFLRCQSICGPICFCSQPQTRYQSIVRHSVLDDQLLECRLFYCECRAG